MDYGLVSWPKVMVLKIKRLNATFVPYKRASSDFTRH